MLAPLEVAVDCTVPETYTVPLVPVTVSRVAAVLSAVLPPAVVRPRPGTEPDSAIVHEVYGQV